MTDIERTIREAMSRVTDYPAPLTRDEFVAGLVAAVQLMREPGLPSGWSVMIQEWGHDKGGMVRHCDGEYRAYLMGQHLGPHATRAEAIAAVEARRADR